MSRYIHRGYFLRISAISLAIVAASGNMRAQSNPAPDSGTQAPTASNTAQTTEDKVFTLVGAGDIAGCGAALAGAESTAKLIEKIPGEVFASGDLA